jgi:hypothetical protein
MRPVTGEPRNDEELDGAGLSRRDMLLRIAAGTAFAVPVIASFDMSSLTVSAAEAYGPNQFGTAPTITSANSATFVVGTAGSFTVNTGSDEFPPTSIEESGPLPGGVTFTDNRDGTATLAGTPTVASGGVYNLTVIADDGVPPNATQAFVLTVQEPPAFTTPSTLVLTTGKAGSLAIETTGYPTPTIVETGPLPSGIGFKANPANGTAIIAGLPGTAARGVYTVTLTATNSVGSATQTLTVTVDEPISVLGPETTTFTVGHKGQVTFTVTGFPAPSVQTLGRLPTGMKITAAGGAVTLSGTPAKRSQGRYVVGVQASAPGLATILQTFTVTVVAPPKKKPKKKPKPKKKGKG